MASVKFNNVSKTFAGGSRALVDFDLEIEDGELMVMVGPSGCGKSTALRLLAGLESVSRGELLIAGKVVNTLTPQQRNIAMVFQNYALYPHMSVRRNLAFPLKMLKLTAEEKQRRIAWAAELLQLDALLERTPKQLSGGQRQRVAMGRAIVREPQVFLMDEPLSNLDAKMRIQIRGEIAALQRRLGITMLYVTHDQVEAMTLGDRVAVVAAGCLQQVAVPQRLYARPANTFVAGFIGNPGMNLLPARLRRAGSGLQIEVLGRWLEVAEQGTVTPAVLAAHVNRELSIGLRPEAIQITDKLSAMLEMTLTDVEELGHERLLYFDGDQTGQGRLVARQIGAQAPVSGGMTALSLDMASMYYFDSQGNAIYSDTT